MKPVLTRFHGTDTPVYGAFDLSSHLDLTALALAVPFESRIHLSTRCWIPRASIMKREKTNKDRFLQWAAEGWLKIIEGEVIDYKVILKDVAEFAKVLNIAEISADPWGLEFLAQKLEEEGYTVVEFRQGYKTMSPATKTFEALVYGKVLVHDGNPLLRWALGNCKIESDGAGNQKPSKKKSTGKIDPLIASIMAACRAEMVMNRGGKSIYETQGLTLL